MSYIQKSDLDGKVPASMLLQALDDNNDGVEDDGIWDSVVRGVQDAIDGFLEANFTVPLEEPLPAIVREAAKILTAEAVYMRRGLSGDQNPWIKQADAMRTRLEAIGSGEKQLTPEQDPQGPQGIVIQEPSRLNNGPLLML